MRFLLMISGYVCIALPQETLNDLRIPMMVENNSDPHKTAYTHTVDYKHGQPFIQIREAISSYCQMPSSD